MCLHRRNGSYTDLSVEARGSDRRASPKAFRSSSQGHSPPEKTPHGSHGLLPCITRPARPSVWGLSSLEISCSCQVCRNQDGRHGKIPTPASVLCLPAHSWGSLYGGAWGKPPSVLGPVARTLPYPEPHSQYEAMAAPILQLVEKGRASLALGVSGNFVGFWVPFSTLRVAKPTLRKQLL